MATTASSTSTFEVEIPSSSRDDIGLLKPDRRRLNRRLRQLLLAACLMTFAMCFFLLGRLTSGGGAPAAVETWALEEQPHDCDADIDVAHFEHTSLCAPHTNLSLVQPLGWGTGQLLTFLVVGDWGRDGTCCQRDVAMEMENAAATPGAEAAFIVSTGDNFYPDGIQEPTDANVGTSFTSVYDQPRLSGLHWYSSLGNHDYHQRAAAQLELGTLLGGRWIQPTRYYDFHRALPSPGGGTVHLVVLDTNVMIPYYRAKPHKYRGLNYSAATVEATAATQLGWLRTVLAGSNATWKLVIGHHPIWSSSHHAFQDDGYLRTHLLPVLEAGGVAAYFSGHDHDLQHLHPPDVGLSQFVSGAGSKVRDEAADGPRAADVGAVMRVSRPGFAHVSLSASVLRINFVDYTGAWLYLNDVANPTAALAARDAAEAASGGLLGGLQVRGRHVLADIDDNLSGVVVLPTTPEDLAHSVVRLLVAINKNHATGLPELREYVVPVAAAGAAATATAVPSLQRIYRLAGFEDVEGLTLIGGRTVLLAEERRRAVCLLTLPAAPPIQAAPAGGGGRPTAATTSLQRSTNATVLPLALPPISNSPNKGFEGIAYDALAHAIYVTVEKAPMRVLRISLPSAPYGGGGVDGVEAANVTDAFDVLTTLGTAGGSALTDLAGLTLLSRPPPAAPQLVLLSQESKRIVRLELGRGVGGVAGTGTISVLESVDLDAAVVGSAQPEGIVLSADAREAWIACEPNVLLHLARP